MYGHEESYPNDGDFMHHVISMCKSGFGQPPPAQDLCFAFAKKQKLKSFFIAPYEVFGDGDRLTFRSTTGAASEVRICITDLSGKEITAVATALTDAPFTIDLPEDCLECIIRLYDNEDIYQATY